MSEKSTVEPIRPRGVEVSSAAARRSSAKLNEWIGAASFPKCGECAAYLPNSSADVCPRPLCPYRPTP